MPTRPPGACRAPHCPQLASRDGWCRGHWRAPFAGYQQPMPGGWARLRRAILTRDAYRCVDCGARAASVDHVVPRAWGGTDDPANLESVCARHHAERTARTSAASRRA